MPVSCPAPARHLSFTGHTYVVETTAAESSTPNFSADVGGDEPNNQDWEQAIIIKDKSEANLIGVLSQVGRVADELILCDELAIQSAEITVQAWKTNFIHGRTMPDTIGASVYAASRSRGYHLRSSRTELNQTTNE